LAGYAPPADTIDSRSMPRRETAPVVRVSLLIPSHALPDLSYRVPEHLAREVRVGTAVVATLSGYSRLGVVVGFERAIRDRPLEELRAVAEGLSLPESLVELCGWTAGAAALPLHAVLRMALPPGLGISLYEVRRPAPGWSWKVGTTVTRAQLRRALGGEGLKAAEQAGRIVFAPAAPARRTVEWAVAEGTAPESLRRAPRQRALLEALTVKDESRPVADLLHAVGSGRDTLRRLVRRGAVRLEKRPEPVPISYTKGTGSSLAAYKNGAKRTLSRGGDWVWQMPDAEGVRASAAVARSAVGGGEQALVLAPEVGEVERLMEEFKRLLPAGLTVAPYHGGLYPGARAAVYEASYRGEVDVLVGTRAAVLVPFQRLGTVCVVDEPNGAHRASPGYEGVPIHVRDIARARGRIEGATVVFFSSVPSLRLYAPESGSLRLPAVTPDRWPAVSVVDMRGTGVALSSTLLEACRRTILRRGRTGVVVNRLGHATSVSCTRCGFVWRCPVCDLPLRLQGAPGAGSLFCTHCGHKEDAAKECPACSSARLNRTGLTIERVRAELAETLDLEVGLLTAGAREGEEAPVVVGTARCVLEGEWDVVVLPDADSFLFGGAGSAEKGFRLLYGMAQVSRERLLVQTRSPEHRVLRAALRGDYEAFAAAELPKRRALGYPPHAHLAEVVFEGTEEMVRRAVESRLRPSLRKVGVEMLDPAPFSEGGRPVWRVLLRSRRRATLAKAATLVARLAVEARGWSRGGLKTHINMDPEEV
jgi:primosomal protein N' (replication factor Y) (superfamily II helicase)